METRFSIDNRFRNISFDQFRNTAGRLEESLRNIHPAIISELLLTTNRQDYYGFGSLTIIIPEKEQALSRRERYPLSDLDEKLWQKSFKTDLWIKDNTLNDLYAVVLSVEEREPKSLKFYGQYIDKKSQEILEQFKKETKFFQKIGDGFHKPSDFAIGYALDYI
ncbi:MAG: hypothetical protein AABX29_07030 [Nanoarchaeota archaeon]|mgnify:CR=1 FL=1